MEKRLVQDTMKRLSPRFHTSIALLLMLWAMLAAAAALRSAATRQWGQWKLGAAAQPAGVFVGAAVAASVQGPGRGSTHAGPLASLVACDNSTGLNYTSRELDLQQQRRCILAATGGRPSGGYVSLCLAVKNQHLDLPQWLDYYRRLGVSQVYAMEDQDSEPPLDDVLRPFVEAGFVTHRKMPGREQAVAELKNATCREYFIDHKQLQAYAYCLLDYGARHQWMGFVDPDEFLVLLDGTPDLPSLLRDYEGSGAVAFNWRMFGSSGHLTRQDNMLLAYTQCNDEQHPENTHVKLFGNTAHMTSMASPHSAFHAPGYSTVTTNGQVLDGPWTPHIDVSRAALNHYVLRSREEFEEKMARGSPMSRPKTWEYWNATEALMNYTCDSGVRAYERLYGPLPTPKARKPARRAAAAQKRPGGGGKEAAS